MRKTRRMFDVQERLAILRLHLLEGKPISEVCEQYQLQPTVFYRWQKELFENGLSKGNRKGEEAMRQRLEAENEALRSKLQDKDEVIAELLEEHLRLKKSLGEAEGTMGGGRGARRRG